MNKYYLYTGSTPPLDEYNGIPPGCEDFPHETCDPRQIYLFGDFFLQDIQYTLNNTKTQGKKIQSIDGDLTEQYTLNNTKTQGKKIQEIDLSKVLHFSDQKQLKYSKVEGKKIQTISSNNQKFSNQFLDSALIIIKLQRINFKKNDVVIKGISWIQRRQKKGKYSYSRNLYVRNNFSLSRGNELLDYFYDNFYISYKTQGLIYETNKSTGEVEEKIDSYTFINEITLLEEESEPDQIYIQYSSENVALVPREEWLGRGLDKDYNYRYWRNIDKLYSDSIVISDTNETLEKIYNQE